MIRPAAMLIIGTFGWAATLVADGPSRGLGSLGDDLGSLGDDLVENLEETVKTKKTAPRTNAPGAPVPPKPAAGAAAPVKREAPTPAAAPGDLADSAAPLDGTPTGGTFCGALEPWGFAKIVPVGNGNPWGGYSWRGLALASLSGCNHISYGHYHHVLVCPWAGELEAFLQPSGRSQATASNCRDSNNTSLLHLTVEQQQLEMRAAASRRCAIYAVERRGEGPFHVIVDASHRQFSRAPWQFGSQVEIAEDGREIVGWHRYDGGWAGAQDSLRTTYQIFFCVRVEKAAQAVGTWRREPPPGKSAPAAPVIRPGNRIEKDTGRPSIVVPELSLEEVREMMSRRSSTAPQVGAYLRYDGLTGGQLKIKVGQSQRSIAEARANLEREIPGWDLGEVERAARAKWNEALGSIRVEGAAENDRRAFYGAFRHCLLNPTDKTGEHRADPAAPYYDDYFAGWDTYPCKDPLLMLALPRRYGAIMDGMLTAAKHLGGYLFDVLAMDQPGPYQGYCSSEIWLAEAIQKRIPFDTRVGMETLIRNATTEPPPRQARGLGRNRASYSFGRQGPVFPEHGPHGCGQYGLDRTVADYAIALAALAMGDEATHRKFKAASMEWRNHWDPEAELMGFKGFLCPQGKFNEHNPFWGLFNVRHDVAGIIAIVGGPEAMQARLDKALGNRPNYRPGNEPYLFWPLIHHWLGRPDRSAWLTRGAVNSRADLPEGLALIGPGADDNGGLTAHYLWCALGLYPVAGQDVYLITSPCFPRIVFPRDGRSFTVIAEGTSRENLYVQSATLNGRPLVRAWFRHHEIADGGELRLAMGNAPSDWGAARPPPSVSDTK